jgi:hypothetical protein
MVDRVELLTRWLRLRRERCGDPMTQTRAEIVPGVFEAHEDYNAAPGGVTANRVDFCSRNRRGHW